MNDELESLSAENRELRRQLREQIEQADRALAESGSLLQAILDYATAMIYVKGADHRYRLVNRRFEDLNHVRREDIIGKTAYDVLPTAAADLVHAHDQRVLDTQAPLEWEEQLPLDDDMRTFLSQRFPLWDLNGQLSGVCGISTDITERVQQEHQRMDELQSLRSVVADAPVGVSIVDAVTGRMLTVNAEAERIHGFPHQPELGWTAYERAFVRRRPDGRVYEVEELPLRRALHGEAVRGEEMWFEFPDGRRVHVLLNVTPVYGEDGRLGAVIATFEDITGRQAPPRTPSQELRLSQIATTLAGSGQPEAASVSERGLTRQTNEDSVYCEPADSTRAKTHGWLYAVADGMGGAAMGEAASRTAIQALVDAYYRSDGGRSDGEGDALLAAVSQANDAVLAASHSRPDYRGMGTTLTALLLRENRLTVAHAGDSRAYLIRAGRIEQLTQDHSWVAELVRAGALTPEQLRTFRYRNMITRYLGRDKTLKVDRADEILQDDDLLLLCSDGLHGKVDDADIALLATSEPAQQAVSSLVKLAQRQGSEDDTSVVIVRWRRTGGPSSGDG